MKRNLIYTLKFIQLIVLFAVLFAYAMFQGGFVSWFLFYSFLPVLIYMALLLLYPISHWKVTRHLSTNITKASDTITVDINIKRIFPFPIYYCVVEDFFPSSLQQPGVSKEKYRQLDKLDTNYSRRNAKKVAFPWFKRNFRYQYTLTDIPRGEHHLNAIRVRIGDFLGFIKKDYIYQVENELLVYPSVRKVNVVEKINSLEEGITQASTARLKSTNVVTGVREYMPGDRFAWIDWKTTARKNTIMTKEFEQEKSVRTMLILDSSYYDGMNKLAYEAAIELCSSLITAYRKQSSPLGFLSIGQTRAYFPFHRDVANNRMVYHFLAKVNPGGDFPFSYQLTEEIKKLPQGLIVMLVVTTLEASLQTAISNLAIKSKHVIVHLIKPLSSVSNQDRQLINQLRMEGVVVNLITEEQLIKQEFEVNV